MIRNFRHKGLRIFFETGSKSGIQSHHANKIRDILSVLNKSNCEKDMDLYGLYLHSLHGDLKGYWSVSVNGPWRIIFTFVGTDAVDVDYLNYH